MASGMLPHEVDLQQAVLERGSLDLDMVVEVEVALERTSRNAAVQNFVVAVVEIASGLRPAIVNLFCCAVMVMSSGAKPATASAMR